VSYLKIFIIELLPYTQRSTPPSIYYYISLSVLRPGFSEEDYLGNEGPEERTTLPNVPCTLMIRLLDTTIEDNLIFQIIPRTISEYTDANGEPPTGTLIGANASSKNMC